MTPGDLSRLGSGVSEHEVDSRIAGPRPALPLTLPGGRRIGCVIAGHEDDPALAASVLLENLPAKATATKALRAFISAQGTSGALTSRTHPGYTNESVKSLRLSPRLQAERRLSSAGSRARQELVAGPPNHRARLRFVP